MQVWIQKFQLGGGTVTGFDVEGSATRGWSLGRGLCRKVL